MASDMDNGLLADYWTSRVVIKFIRSFSELYKAKRDDEMTDDIVLLMYQYSMSFLPCFSFQSSPTSPSESMFHDRVP